MTERTRSEVSDARDAHAALRQWAGELHGAELAARVALAEARARLGDHVDLGEALVDLEVRRDAVARLERVAEEAAWLAVAYQRWRDGLPFRLLGAHAAEAQREVRGFLEGGAP